MTNQRMRKPSSGRNAEREKEKDRVVKREFVIDITNTKHTHCEMLSKQW